MDSFDQKVAVVTGAASGIGRALAEALAKEGASLAICDMNEPELTKTKEMVERYQVPVIAKKLDVSDRNAMEAFAAEVEAQYGKVNLVFNNAGVALSAGVEEMAYEDLDWLMNINFMGVVYGTKTFLPLLKASGEGHLINVSSVFGLIGIPSQSAYNAAKFAVRGFTEALQHELADEGGNVHASVVCPGGIDTNIVRNSRLPGVTDAQGREEAIKGFKAMAPTTPAQAAQTILKGVRARKKRILIGNDAKLLQLISLIFPTNYRKVLGMVMGLGRRSGRSANDSAV